jgi:hypothetical protein
MIRDGLHLSILTANAGAVPRHFAARQIVAPIFFSEHPGREDILNERG